MKSVLPKTVYRRRSLHALATTLGVLLFAVSLFGQGNFGRILGTVSDQTGAILPGATVTVLDTQRGTTRTMTTDASGGYNAPTLIPGTYTVRVDVKGFKRLDRPNVLVEVGKEIRIDLVPQPGDQTQTVTVTESVPLVDAASATLGGTLANSEINDMPLNGRNYQNLLALRPGVMIQPGGSPWTQSTNGVRPDETVWMVDGIINVNFHDYRPLANMPSPFTDGATILPIDAIQEFNLEENPKAEYGWKPGATVNVGIKSGTNTMHGSAYAFGRYSGWAARNLFNQAPNEKLPTELKQYGGVAGGAIIKDKLFYFGGYEALRSLVGNALGTNVPALGSLGDPSNSMVDAIKSLQSHGVAVNPISLQLMGCTAAATTCTGGLIQGASATSTSFVSTFPNQNTSDNGVGKIDYNINEKNRINGLFFIGDYLADGEDHPITSKNWQNADPLKAYTISGNWVYIANSSTVNEFRMGYNKVNFLLAPDDANLFANGKDYPLNTGVTSTGGFPSVDITGFGSGTLGSWRGRPTEFHTHFFDFQENLSVLKGKHALKFGFEYSPIADNFYTHDTRGRIQFRGKQAYASSTPLEDFFAGLPQRAFVLVGDSNRNYTFKNIAGFVQDDWRLSPKLMVNVGLRYSAISPMKEDNNLLGNFDPASKFGMVQQGDPSVGDTLWKPDHKNFSPRAGFAYDVSGKGTTVVRGGASVIYSMFNPAQFSNSPQNFGGGNIAATPTGACQTTVLPGTPCPATFGGTIGLGTATIPGSKLNWNGPVFPVGAQVSCTAGAPCNLMAVDPNYKMPYIVNFNVGVQHAFSNNLSLEVGYVGTHGERLSNFLSLNQIDPAGNGQRPYATKFPYLQYIDEQVNNGRSNYHSLQTTMTKRVSHGLSFTTGYTYGHGLDSGSLSRFGLLPQNSKDPGAEYASSDFDVRHRLTVTASYTIPGKKGFGQVLEGWKLNTIVSLQTGQPWLMSDTGNDFSGSGDSSDRWNFYGNPSDFMSSSSSIPYCTGPGAGGCSTQSGVSGIQSFFTAAQSTAMWGQCTAAAPDQKTLGAGGCYVSGSSVMTPPKAGTFGTMGRNIFRDPGFKNVDFSLFKEFSFKERYGAQFRIELFNIFNHPNLANPYGASNGAQIGWDPSSSSNFGCGCSTPDVASGNPLVGSGSSRVMQLGLKLIF